MLSESSYLFAISTYVSAAIAALLCLVWWLRKRWHPGWLVLIFLLGAALLLTPAYPSAGITTLAPALIVAGFQILTHGVENAQHALRPLGFMLGLAMLLSAVLWLLVLRKVQFPAQQKSRSKPSNAQE